MQLLGTKWALVLLSLLSAAQGQLEFGFGQIDYTNPEPNGVTVEVIKRNVNVGDLYINITPLTYAQLASMAFPVPPEIDQTTLPDAAEFELNGKQDFVNDAAIQVMFPASNLTQEVEERVNISFINDDTNEAQEAFYVVATIDSTLSNPTDVQQATAIRNGVALIRINDDDPIQLSFEQPDFGVSESDGLLDNLIFVVKENGIASEQLLRIFVEAVPSGSDAAVRGPRQPPMRFDYIVPELDNPGPNSDPLELIFDVADSRLNVSIDIIDDSLLESNESFVLLLSIPQNPAVNQLTGTFSLTTVHIADDEVGRIGFVQSKYNVSEGTNSLDVCVSILEPPLADIAPNVQAFLFAETVDGTATGGADFVPLVASTFAGDNIDLLNPAFMSCANVAIIDDSISEITEEFQLSLVTDDMQNGFINANFVFDPITTDVCIIDNEMSPSPSPSPSPSSSASPSPTPSSTEPPGLTATEVVVTPSPSMTPTTSTGMNMGGDPHYSILLPTGQLLCYSVHGEHDFVFNLISNKVLQMNALFIADSRREEVTWIGELGIVVKDGPRKRANTTALRFCATESMVCIGDKVKLQAQGVEKITFANGKLSISERSDEVSDRPEVLVEFPNLGISFSVRFVRGRHLDMSWNKVETKMGQSHGMIGQFFRPGVEIDEARRLLVLPEMEPVPVMRKPVWHFMERDTPEDDLCWVAMNPGYQGKKLLQGHYLDYLVDDVLSNKFKFKPKQRS